MSDATRAEDPVPPPTGSGAFDRLHPRVQRWIWDAGWRELRPIQAAAIGPALAGSDVVIASPTSSGKTEAAWLPIMSALAPNEQDDPGSSGVQVLYLSPLKALINDQYLRLSTLGRRAGVPVHRRHGDVPEDERNRLREDPAGALLTTPESLEAQFVRTGPELRFFYAGLRYVVVDELHSFMGTERGAQLQSLLHRLERLLGRRIARIGLSATLPDLAAAAGFLRPTAPDSVHLLSHTGEGNVELRLQVRGYREATAGPDATQDGTDHSGTAETAIAEHLFSTLRGGDNLVFANSRATVELYADRLARRASQENTRDRFLPHHGSLSRASREEAERRLRQPDTPTTVVCTSTLEMGIDIGSTDAVAQIGAPGSVAAIRQRLGRSGRRDNPAVLRIYVTEPQIDQRTSVVDRLRPRLVQSIAVTELMLHEHWYEGPNLADLHLSTLIQQILSVIAERGGATAHAIYTDLCGGDAFTNMTADLFKRLLRDMADADLLEQAGDGLLLLGSEGERLAAHHSFYAAFRSPVEYTVIGQDRPLGTLPLSGRLQHGDYLIFTGRRWVVDSIDHSRHTIKLAPAHGGRPPSFGGDGILVPDAVRRKMRQVLHDDGQPEYLDAAAAGLLGEGRNWYRELRLAERQLLRDGNQTLVVPWRGDRVLTTITLMLRHRGVPASHYGLAVVVRDTEPAEVRHVLARIAAEPAPEAMVLAAVADDKESDKYDRYLSEPLLNRAYAGRHLDVPAAHRTIEQLTA